MRAARLLCILLINPIAPLFQFTHGLIVFYFSSRCLVAMPSLPQRHAVPVPNELLLCIGARALQVLLQVCSVSIVEDLRKEHKENMGVCWWSCWSVIRFPVKCCCCFTHAESRRSSFGEERESHVWAAEIQ